MLSSDQWGSKWPDNIMKKYIFDNFTAAKRSVGSQCPGACFRLDELSWQIAGFNTEVDLGMDTKNETLFLP